MPDQSGTFTVPGFGKLSAPVKPGNLMHGPTEYRILDQELQRRGIHPYGVTGSVPEDGRFQNYSDPWAIQCWDAYRKQYGSVVK